MKYEDLKQCDVVFREEDHTYWLGDLQLQGITKMIQRQIFPDKYKGVKQSVLQNRADFGHEFHKQMELWIKTGIETSSDMFRVFKENYRHIRFIASEYLVTDKQHFASSIDAVDEDCILYDFKTSSKKDIPYWQWQLTVYSILFCEQNGFYPNGLKVLWINKDLKHELVDITPLPYSMVVKMMQEEIAGRQFVMPSNTSLVPVADVTAIEKLETEIIAAETRLKQLKADRDAFADGVLSLLQEKGVKSWETDKLKFTVKDAYERTSVDSKTLKDNFPAVYDQVLKTSKVKASLTIKIKEAV